MTHNDNAVAQMLLFPIQEKRVDECDTAHEMILQVKLTWANTLNLISEGKVVLSEFDRERCIKTLNRVNEIFKEHGFSAIHFCL